MQIIAARTSASARGTASSGKSAGPAHGAGSYDPELDLFYYGTANPGPWNPDLRPGDNKWSCTLFARRPETGEAVWAYQMVPHDNHDYDGVNENILLDLTINGKQRKVLAHPDRNGYVYIIDRTTGEVISANAFVFINNSDGVDLKTGRLKVVDAKTTGFKTTRDICPAPPGGKDWQPSSFSAKTGLIYIPHNNLCYEMQGTQANYIALPTGPARDNWLRSSWGRKSPQYAVSDPFRS